jgi:hypothetical protein
MGNKHSSQYLAAFNPSYNIVLQKLIEYLYNKDIIPTDKKMRFTKFAILRVLFDYADEVVKGFHYTPEQLVELIDMHDSMKTKFERLLKEMSENPQNIPEPISNININEEIEGDESEQ